MTHTTSTLFAPLRSPHYRRLMLSNMLWWPVVAMWTVVAGALVLDITNSALAVTLLSFWRRAAQLSVGGLAGPVGDRVGRRHTLILTQGTILVALVAVLALYLAGGLTAWHMGIAAFLIGAAWSVDLPARNALIPDLVGRDLSVDAMLLESFIQGIVSSASAFLAGWLLDTFGAWACFGVLVVISAVNVTLLVFFSRHEIRRTTAVSGQSIWRAIGGDLGAGVSYIRHHQPILAVTLVSAVLNTWIFPSMSLLPVFARDVLMSSALGLGLLSAGYNAGNFTGLVIANRLRRTLPIGILFTLGALLECVALAAFAFSGVYALSWALIFVAGIGQAGFHTMRGAILLTEASDDMRGRALSTVGLTQGVGLIGEMQTGLLAERIGAPVTAGVQSGGAALLSGIIFLWLPAIWRAGKAKVDLAR